MTTTTATIDEQIKDLQARHKTTLAEIKALENDLARGNVDMSKADELPTMRTRAEMFLKRLGVLQDDRLELENQALLDKYEADYQAYLEDTKKRTKAKKIVQDLKAQLQDAIATHKAIDDDMGHTMRRRLDFMRSLNERGLSRQVNELNSKYGNMHAELSEVKNIV